MRSIRRKPTRPLRAAAERAAEVLAKDPRARLVFLFGSAADPERSSARDADIAVLFDRRLPTDELVRIQGELSAEVKATIDLVSLNDAGVVLAREVADTGQCLYTREPEAETDFVIRARSRYWDFKPFLDEQWRLSGERIAERRGSQT